MVDGTLETKPQVVERRTSEHFFVHFDVNRMATMMVGEEWAGDYPVHAPDLFQPAGSPISGKLLDWYISCAPRHKVPGKSGVPFELLQMLSNSACERFRADLNRALETGIAPAQWKTAVICPIPKKTGISGQLVLYCPITLLETTRKLLTWILTDHLSHIIEDNGLLTGLN
ncbi:hypothetical protein LPJ69_003982, partial [Coemansia sp. RSA 1752]